MAEHGGRKCPDCPNALKLEILGHLNAVAETAKELSDKLCPYDLSAFMDDYGTADTSGYENEPKMGRKCDEHALWKSHHADIYKAIGVKWYHRSA